MHLGDECHLLIEFVHFFVLIVLEAFKLSDQSLCLSTLVVLVSRGITLVAFRCQLLLMQGIKQIGNVLLEAKEAEVEFFGDTAGVDFNQVLSRHFLGECTLDEKLLVLILACFRVVLPGVVNAVTNVEKFQVLAEITSSLRFTAFRLLW